MKSVPNPVRPLIMEGGHPNQYNGLSAGPGIHPTKESAATDKIISTRGQPNLPRLRCLLNEILRFGHISGTARWETGSLFSNTVYTSRADL